MIDKIVATIDNTLTNMVILGLGTLGIVTLCVVFEWWVLAVVGLLLIKNWFQLNKN